MQNFHQTDKFFVFRSYIVWHFFILDLNDFLALMCFYKIDFSLKNKLRAYFAVLSVILLANSM